MLTAQEYRESLRRYRPRVFVDGEAVESVADEPRLAPGIAAIGVTYDFATRPEYAEVNDILGTLRPSAKKVLPTDTDRKRFFDGIIARGVVDMLRRGKRRQAYETIAKACAEAGVEPSERLRAALK